MSVAARLMVTLAALSFCACGGCCTGLLVQLPGEQEELRTHVYPYPHHIPKQPDGVSLRFAMVNDVVHERFPRHGPAYYRDRNRRVRKSLAELKERGEDQARPSERYFALLDDLAVGLEFVGEHDEAIRVMRDKLRVQEAHGRSGRALYSTYANLGTFLILGPFREVRPGNEDDKQVLREGLALIRQSIKVNPDAHFGREIWQAVLVEYMIALLDQPELLLQYDMIGNSLDSAVDPSERRCLASPERYGGAGGNRVVAEFLAGKAAEERRQTMRKEITTVGAENGARKVVPSLSEPVPFDEPTLGIIGMWRLGGGAHPYFALALGEIMLRVGQRYLAWSAYQRSSKQSLNWPTLSRSRP